MALGVVFWAFGDLLAQERTTHGNVELLNKQNNSQ